jgi:hypothetical protein
MPAHEDDFTDQAATVARTMTIAKEITWHAYLKPGSKLRVVIEAGETIAEFSLLKPLH